DDDRRARDRSPRLRHRALLRPRADPGAHPRPDVRGVQQDLRHRAPGRAGGLEPRRAAEPLPRPGARAGGGLLRDRRVGAAALVRVEPAAPRRGSRPPPAPPADNTDRPQPGPAEWDARWWSPIINAEHLAMRDRVAMVDLTAFAVFDVAGPNVLDYIQRLAVAEMDVPVGRVVYTSLLNEAGGIKADLTIMRLGADHF